MSSDERSPRRICLIRHGRSAHVQTGWLDADGFKAWRAAYEAAGVAADERVPAALADCSGHIVSSDAARAIDSARMLAVGREIETSPLLRELDLHSLPLGRLRMPMPLWALAVGAQTLSLTVRGRYPSAAEARRIDDAATWLEGLALSHASVLAVTHASFRSRLAKRLEQRGWRATASRRTLQPWSRWDFVRDDAVRS